MTNTSTTAQCGSEIVGENGCSIGVNNPAFCSAGHCQRCSDFRDGWNMALQGAEFRQIQSELAAALKALEAAGSLICGYESGCSIDGIKTLENAYTAARAARSSKEPEGK